MAKKSESFTAGYGEDFSGRVYPLEASEPAIGDDERLRLPVPTGEPYRLPAELAQPSATPKDGASPDIERQWKEAARRLARGGIIYPDQEEQIERAARAQKSGVYDPSIAESLRNLAGSTAVQQYKYFTHPIEEEFTEPPPNWVQTDEFSPGRPGDQGVDPSPAQAQAQPAATARPASPAKMVTGRAGRRLGGAFLNLPEDLRPEILPGGFAVYPDNRENYEARLNQAVEDGKVSPAVAKKVMAGYDKWRRTPWGASVDYTRLVREQKHIQQESERDANLIESQRADQEAQLRQKLVEASQQLQADYEEERAIQIEELDNQLAKQQQAIEELQTTRVDPSRWWNSKSDAQKAVSAISLALGTLGSGLSGIYGRPSPNVAYDMIKNAINNDIRAQEADLGSRRAALSGRQNLMTTIFGKVKDAATASNMARMALLDQTKAKLDMYAASAVGDTARRNAQMLRELIDNDREIVAAEIRMNAGNAARAAAAARAKAKTVRRGPVLVSKDDKRMISQVFGGIVQGIDPDGLRALEKEVHDNNALATSIYDIKQMMASPGAIMGTKLAAKAERIHQAIQQGERKKQFGTAFTVREGDTDYSGMLTENAVSRMRTAWRDMFHGSSIPLEGLVEKRAAELRQRVSGLTVFPGATPLSSYEIQSGGKAGQRETATVWSPTGPEQRVVDAIVVNPDGTRSFRTKAVQHGVSAQRPSVHESLKNTKRRGPQTGQ